jgi:Flp pilus assembly protein TadG
MRDLRRCRGQSLVEAALTVPIAVTIMLGVVEFGAVYFTRASIENGAREGARYGSIHPTDVSGIESRVRQMVTGVDPATIQVDVTYPDGDTLPSDRIRVTVTYPLATFWPGPASGTYDTAATMRIETQS